MSITAARTRLLRESLAPYSGGEAGNTHTKLSISLPSDLAEIVRAAAAESGLSVSATIAAALRRTVEDAEQTMLDSALDADREEDRERAVAYGPIAAEVMAKLEW
jgi:metal-responsive CopG/Arc/MetJ family transcriptional regulator